MSATYTLKIQCPDKPGLVASVASFLADRGGNIIDAQQFDDRQKQRFFTRIAFEPGSEWNIARLREEFAPVADRAQMTWSLTDDAVRQKVVLMVSRFEHCMLDLLYRVRLGELPMDVVAIVSNHPREFLETALTEDIPFYHFPITRETKAQQELQVRKVIEDTGADLVVLARYMQILSDDFARFLSGRCRNIHHSFLPGVKGAKPYHQAHERGGKMIGATAHYVTADLDEGPIIYQDVEAITHADTPEELVRKGRDIERRVLAEAVRLHLRDRVFMNDQRTVDFQG